jgi:putative aldouronate transport system substrate-binding protein
MKKRVFTCLCAVALIVVGLTACSEKQADDGPLKITLASVQGREAWDYNNGDAYATFWSEKFNYELEVAALGWDNWSSQLAVWISSQDMTDVAVYNYNHAEAAGFVEQGLIKRFPDDWKERWPNVAATYEKTTLGPYIEDLFGGTYFIPRARFDKNLPGDPLPNHQSLFMRRDWVEAVGYPVKTQYTTTEIMELARLIKAQDPGKVGANLIPIAGTADNAAELFVKANSTYWDNFYRDTDGVFKWGPASPDTLTGLKLYYEAYSTGLLDPEFYLVAAEEDRYKLTMTGIAAMLVDQLPTAEVLAKRQEFTNNLGLPPELLAFATPLGVDGNYHRQDLINFWATICFNPDVSDEVFERWMDVMEYACTPEGYVTTVMGLKDVDWRQEANGDYVSLLKEGEMLAGDPGEGKYPSMGGYIYGSVILWDDFAFDNPNIPESYRDESWKLYTERAARGTPETFAKVDWDLYTYDSPNKRRVVYQYADEYANIVTNATSMADLETKWRAWVDQQMPIVQPVLDELNAL